MFREFGFVFRDWKWIAKLRFQDSDIRSEGRIFAMKKGAKFTKAIIVPTHY